MKKGLKYSLSILIAIVVLVGLYIASKLQYRYIVQPDLYDKISGLYKEYGEAGPMVINIMDENHNLINTDNGFVRVRLERFEYINKYGSRVADSRDIIEISDDSTLWRTLVTLPGFTCNYGSVTGNKLYCVGPDLSVISVDLKSGHQKKIRGTNWSMGGLVGMYQNDSRIVLVWRDRSARWSTIWAFIPLPTSAVTEIGPWLIMVGELDPYTGRIKESVIKYDSYDFP